MVAPSLPPVDWSPCCYLAGSPTLTREHRRHRNSQTWLLAPPLFLFCRAFTRADFSTSQFFPLHMWVFGFRLCPKLGISWCKAQLISPVHECSHAARFNIFVVRVMLAMFTIISKNRQHTHTHTHTHTPHTHTHMRTHALFCETRASRGSNLYV